MKIGEKLLVWYSKNKRKLPWRETKEPYKIWVSEIILQQTRVNQGLNYYLNFIEKFPTVDALAKANEIDVLKAWEGLGYYSRARNMHFSAKYILSELNGIFPSKYEEILKLKGVGEYTAAAISSICFNYPKVVVDGNVIRVISRLVENYLPINKSKKIVEKYAQEILIQSNAGDFNQALMELGAVICTPVNPNCENCPINAYCKAFQKNIVNELPVKSEKLEKSKRYFNYVFFINDDYTYLKKRVDKDIWEGLYEPFLYETKSKLSQKSFENYLCTLINPKIRLTAKKEIKHILSHQEIIANFYIAKIFSIDLQNLNLSKVSLQEMKNFPFSKLVNNYIKLEAEKFI